MKAKTLLKYLTFFSVLTSTVYGEEPSSRLTELRTIREKLITESLRDINEKHLKALVRLKKTHDNPQEIQTEIDKLNVIMSAGLPEKLLFPPDEIISQKAYSKPRLRSEEGITQHLIGSIWVFHKNGEFVSGKDHLYFLDDRTCVFNGEKYPWRIKSDNTLWLGIVESGVDLKFVDKSGKLLKGYYSSHSGWERSATWK